MALTPVRISHGSLQALAGALAAGSALAVGELVTGFDDAGPSLVTAVGDEFIDRFAGSLKELAVSLFGRRDKVALVVGIVVVALAVGAWVGSIARRSRWAPPAAFAAFGVLGAWAYSRAPLTDGAVGVVAAGLGAACGMAVLALLLRLAPDEAPLAVAPAPTPTDGVARSAPGGVAVAPAPAAVGGPTAGPSRRTFLTASLAVAGGATALAAAGRRLRGPDPTGAVRRSLALPAAPGVPVPGDQPFQHPDLSPYITPTDDFYRIDTALFVPRVDVGDWQLTVDGMVETPLTLDFDDLLAMDAVEVPVTLQCVSNEVGGDLVGTAVWQGVPLADVLERVRPRPEATQIVGRSVDGFTAGFPSAVVGDGRTSLIAYAMNGEPLPPRHGFPARLVVAGLYGYVSATKWLSQIELTRWEDFDGYWVPRGWSKEGPIKTASRIDVPRAGADLASGPTAVAGVAWAPTRGISAVEVRVDNGPWQECQLGRTASDETWVQWWFEWDASPGDHVLTVRAVDGAGEVQTDAVAPPAPDGATGLHARRVTVT